MDILNLLSPILENVGFPALIFLIWYVYHNSQVKAMNKIIKNNFEILFAYGLTFLYTTISFQSVHGSILLSL